MAIAERQGVEFDVVEYLKQKPDRATLERIVHGLEDPVGDLVRKDAAFAKLGLEAADYTTPDAVVELLLARPRLMQRPVLLQGERAIIGRPKQRVEGFLS